MALLTIKECADIMYGMTESGVKKMIDSKKIKYHVVNNETYVDSNDLDIVIENGNCTKAYSLPMIAQMLDTNVKRVRELVKHQCIKAFKCGELKVSSFEFERFLKNSAGMDYSDPCNPKKLFGEA